MAVAEKTPAAAEATPAKKGPPIVVIIGLTALVAFGLGFVVVQKFFTKTVKAGPAPIVIGDTVTLDEFLINLADTDSSHYLKVTIGLGLIQGQTAETFKEKIPEARDAIIMCLSAKTLSQVTTTDGKEALKTELLNDISNEVGKGIVGAVYFEGFATQ